LDVATHAADLISLRPYPNIDRLLRRVELNVDRSRVAVSLTLDVVQVQQLSLSEVVALRAALKGRKKSSDLEWLKSCHARLHGPLCTGCKRNLSARQGHEPPRRLRPAMPAKILDQ